MARYDLGLTEPDFWRLTLRELDALLKRHEAAEERRNHRAALICATYANCHIDPKKHRLLTAEDFMPVKRRAPRRMSDDAMLAMARHLNAALGGKET